MRPRRVQRHLLKVLVLVVLDVLEQVLCVPVDAFALDGLGASLESLLERLHVRVQVRDVLGLGGDDVVEAVDVELESHDLALVGGVLGGVEGADLEEDAFVEDFVLGLDGAVGGVGLEAVLEELARGAHGGG